KITAGERTAEGVARRHLPRNDGSTDLDARIRIEAICGGSERPSGRSGVKGRDLVLRTDRITGELSYHFAATICDAKVVDPQCNAFGWRVQSQLSDRCVGQWENIRVGVLGGGDGPRNRIKFVDTAGEVLADLDVAFPVGGAFDFQMQDVVARFIERIPDQRNFLREPEAT